MVQDNRLAGPAESTLRELRPRSRSFSIPAVGLHHLLLAAILCLGLVLGTLRLHPFTAAYGDEARFLMLAQSLRFDGAYSLPSAQGLLAEHQYPPGIPALFALSMWLTGTGQPLASAIVPAKLAVLLFYLAGLLLLYDLLAHYASRWLALAVTLAAAVHPLATAMATEPMSDAPFLAASILTLWLLDRAGRSPTVSKTWHTSSLFWALLAGLAVGLAGNMRLLGVVLIPVGLLYLLIVRRWRAAALFLGLGLLTLLPWNLYNSLATAATSEGGSVGVYMGSLAAVDLYTPEASAPMLLDYIGRVVYNLRTYGLLLSGVILAQPWRELPGAFSGVWAGKLDVGFSLFLALLILPGLIIGFRRKQWLLLLYLAAMQLVLLVWPFVQQRYVLPILPFYWLYLLLGLEWLVSQTPPIWRRWATAGVAMLLIGLFTYLTAINTFSGWSAFSRRNVPSMAAYYEQSSSQWANYFEASHWAATHSQPDAILLARKPYLSYLYDNRVAVVPLWSSNPQDWPAYLAANRVQYVIEDAFTWSDATQRFLRPALAAYPERFELVYETVAPVTRVWRYLGE